MQRNHAHAEELDSVIGAHAALVVDVEVQGVVQVGDAAACTVLIDGRATRPLGPTGKVREITVTRANYTTFLP